MAFGIVSIAATLVYAAAGPVFSAGGPDAESYGAADHFPVGTRANWFEKKYMVGSFSHFDTLYPSRPIAPAERPWEFQRPAIEAEIHYVHAGNHYSLHDYLAHLPITGLLIAKDDQILYEGYQYGRSDQHRFTSQSMAKTIVGMLTGVALSDHTLGSVTDAASKYIPELKNADYGKVTIRDLLHMSSGVTCNIPESEIGTAGLEALAHDCKQSVPAGTKFQYSASDSQVLGIAVSRAARTPLARYLQDKIWQNIGTEAKATWTINGSGEELAFCCFNATLRDYARFARLLAYDGAWNGKQLIPQPWLLDASSVKDTDAQLMPEKASRFFGYGYQMWIFPERRRMFALLGANGQRIFVDPLSKLILVQTAVMEKSMDPPKDAEMIGLWLSLVHHYGAE